ncbi:hypothetical protein N790_07710 [Arenimonas malthae CC-JY-1]|uniref:Outer membrane protein beta-barrel domain-containing protein n=1 Tax=Arenimonas malthae CC-JY-1 TaxID=1384054 RepID=A0A091B802_9GAMM|nr:hypothetical protein [Arenimonas malthae]KFN47642.1 hypothetical protein N790_07710 [Arenimonas malthae CC-JY-1]
MPATAAWLALALAASGDAGAVPRPLDEFSAWVGGFETRSDTTLWAQGRAGDYSASGRVNLEDDLGLGARQPVSHARLDWLLGERQGLSLEYFGFDRGNTVRLDRDIEYDGRTYAADGELRGRFDYDFGSAAWRWWFGEGATAWGLGLGLAYYRVDTLFEGEATVEGVPVAGRARSSDAALAPLLVLGWRHALGDQARVYAELSGVAKGGGPLQGHIVDLALGMEWFPFPRLGLALEYGGTQIRLDRSRQGSDAGLDARLDLKLRGPSLFLRLR